MKNRDNVIIVVGAGSTYSDGLTSLRRGDLSSDFLPPLNRGFFRGCRNSGGYVSELLESVRQAMVKIYGMNPLDESNDNLEGILAKVYCDILSTESSRRKPREELFRSLIHLLNARMVETTNILAPTQTSGIGQIVSLHLNGRPSIAPQDICIITFNYDLHIEKNLQMLDGLGECGGHDGEIFNFPHLYELGDDVRTAAPKIGEIPEFAEASNRRVNRISLLKLHGSLNWYSERISPNPSITELFDPKRDVLVTPKTDLSAYMQSVDERSSAAYPVVIPPIVGKAAVFHRRIRAIWTLAQKRLREATEAVIFGYSFPLTDHEGINLLENTIGRGGRCRHVSVINPDPSVVTRMGMIPRNKPITLFHSAEDFLKFRRTGNKTAP